MSKKPKVLLGPDGKPLDLAKYRPVPAPQTGFRTAAMVLDFKLDATSLGKWFNIGFDSGVGTGPKPSTRRPTQRQKVSEGMTLGKAVERDVAAMYRTLPADWKGHAEAPPPPPETTDTYAVAFESARKNCEHKNSHSTLHARRERQCEDCGRYFTRREWWES